MDDVVRLLVDEAARARDEMCGRLMSLSRARGVVAARLRGLGKRTRVAREDLARIDEEVAALTGMVQRISSALAPVEHMEEE